MSEPIQAEEEFRRGYTEGWEEAIKAVYDLIHFKDLNYQEAYDWCADHHNDTLEPWRDGDCSNHEPPPELPPYRP